MEEAAARCCSLFLAGALQGGGLLLISLPALHSDFLAGFLLFHVTTTIKTPAMGENKLGQKTSN